MKRTSLQNRFPATCLCLALLLATEAALAQSNLVLLVSQPGEPIGGGLNFFTTNVDKFSVSTYAGGWLSVGISSASYSISISGSNAGPIAAGDYPIASYPPDGVTPTLAVFGNGRGCDTVCGSFHVYEFATDGSGNPTRLWLTFTQYCECGGAPMTGEVRYHSQLAPPPPAPRTLLVPSEYPTIQSAIDAASSFTSDTVLVTNGVYYENLDFQAKPLTVTSVNGPQSTIIDGGAGQAVVNIDSENTNALLNGFTLTNASYGVSVYDMSPVIRSNVIINCFFGVYCDTAAPRILNNYISGCTATAAEFAGPGSALLQGNMIVNNRGGGVGMYDGCTATIINNTIAGNAGDGIGMLDNNDPNIIQNIIAGNQGNGISFDLPYGRGPLEVNNVIVGNGGAGISCQGFYANVVIEGNIVVGTPAMLLTSYVQSSLPIILANDFYATNGFIFDGGTFSSIADLPGNISADPWFACEPDGDYHLLAGSSCIDAGTNGALLLPSTDFDGNPRILAGISNNVPTVDLDTYEFNPLTPPVPCLFINCQTDIVVYTSAGQNSVVVNYPAPTATPSATVVCAPPSGSSFYGGTNLVTCTASYGTNRVDCFLNIIVIVAPAISQPPQNVQVSAGQNFTLSVGVTGTPPLTYLWSYQGKVIYGANAATLTITNAQAVNDGVYSVLVYNAAGSTNSSLARVRVVPGKPVIVSNPAPLNLPAGATAVFNVTTTGSQPQAYQWYFDQKPIKGATGAQLVITNVQAGDAGSYVVVVANVAGSVTSKVVLLTVRTAAPSFLAEPASFSVLAGASAILSAVITGSQPLHFQWYFNGRALPNQTNSSLVLPKATPALAGSYYVTVTNAYGRIVSTTAQLIVDVPPQPVRPLTNQVVQAGRNVTLAFPATGSSPISYSWQFNGQTLADTNATLLISNIQTAWSGYYQVTASNPYGSTSAVARVSVVAAASHLVVWGDDSGGQTNVPARLTNVIAAAGGDFHSIALRANGTLVAWGDNSDGQTNIPGRLPPIVSIAAGASHNLAIGADGSLFAWGNNGSGQCSIPAAVTNQPLAVSAGDAHSLALLANGTVTAWGDNTYGQTVLPVVLLPVYYMGSPWGIYKYSNPNWMPASAIAAGRDHNLAVLTNGVVVAWGDNSSGQCEVPPGLTNATAVVGGYLHSVALCGDGTVVAWGDNSYGQTNVPPGLTNVVSIAAGDFNTLALLANGTVIGWGDDSYGQINVPSLVTNAVGIASGYYHSMALIPTVSAIGRPLRQIR